VKWTYKESVVTITAAFRSPDSFRPIVEIDSNSRDPPTALTTAEEALAVGQDMARNWIDRHFKGSRPAV